MNSWPTQHPNYSRAAIKQFELAMASRGFPSDKAQILSHVVELLRTSRKFFLPHGGRLHDDLELKALDESEPLRLPFPVIALEYSRGGTLEPGHGASSKTIVVAREDRGMIVVSLIIWMDEEKQWGPFPEVALPLTGFLNRDLPKQNGRVPFTLHHATGLPAEDYTDEIGALLCLLNVLSCANVSFERSTPKKAKPVKGALPFDSYYVLQVETQREETEAEGIRGTNRSPREHLRRGHIRRLQDGRRLWINATIVAATGRGRIIKDYSLRS